MAAMSYAAVKSPSGINLVRFRTKENVDHYTKTPGEVFACPMLHP